MIRRWLPFVVGIGIVVWLAALVMLAMTAEGPQRFGELYLGILLVNVTGVIALSLRPTRSPAASALVSSVWLHGCVPGNCVVHAAVTAGRPISAL